jgi:hypothetical protein
MAARFHGPAQFRIQTLNRVCTLYKDWRRRSVRLEFGWFRRIVRPPGIDATGARSAGRPTGFPACSHGHAEKVLYNSGVRTRRGGVEFLAVMLAKRPIPYADQARDLDLTDPQTAKGVGKYP